MSHITEYGAFTVLDIPMMENEMYILINILNYNNYYNF